MPAQKSRNAGPEQGAPEQGRKKRRLAFVLLLVLLPAAGGALHWLLLNRQPEAPAYNPNAVVGALPGKTAEQIEAMLNAQIDETTVAFSINSEPVFESGGRIDDRVPGGEPEQHPGDDCAGRHGRAGV